MTIEGLLKRLRQANEIAAEAIAERGDARSALWEKADKIESKIQTELDLETEGLIVEWSTAYSAYIIRAER